MKVCLATLLLVTLLPWGQCAVLGSAAEADIQDETESQADGPQARPLSLSSAGLSRPNWCIYALCK